MTWVRVNCGYEITWVRVDLVRVDFGYELTVNPNGYCAIYVTVSDNARSWQIVSVICGIAKSMLTTPCLKKRPHFYFLNNSVKNEPISIIFSVQNCDET